MEINSSIRQKAFGIMKSIESMNEAERNQRPSQSYGLNYNRLRQLCLEANPELKQLMPPEVELENYGDGYSNILTVHNFSEIHTFCSEIYQLLESNA